MYTIRQKSGGIGKSSPPLRFLSTLEISLNPWDFSQPLRFLSALEISVNPWDFSQPLRFLSTISQYLPHFGGERIQLQWWWKYVKVGNNSAEFFQPSETASNHFPSISLCKGSEVALLVEYLKSLPDENFTAGNLHFNAFAWKNCHNYTSFKKPALGLAQPLNCEMWTNVSGCTTHICFKSCFCNNHHCQHKNSSHPPHHHHNHEEHLSDGTFSHLVDVPLIDFSHNSIMGIEDNTLVNQHKHHWELMTGWKDMMKEW